MRPCDRCGVRMTTARPGTKRLRFCDTCQVDRFRDNGGMAAHRAINKEVQAGRMPRAKDCICVDCGAQACDYDHRDYSKPLEVEPVCRKCNRRRGPALPGIPLHRLNAAFQPVKAKAAKAL